jgi:PAS domain S-box-containing protein
MAEFRGGTLHVVEPIRHEGQYIGALHLHLSTATLRAEMRNTLLTLSLLLCLVLVISLVLSAWLQGIVSGPILRLAEVARRISDSNDLSERAAVPSADEIGKLYRAFNTLLDRLEEHNEARGAAYAELTGAHDALRANEQELATIVETLPLMVFAKDAEGLRYLRFNRAAELFHGIGRERVIGRTDAEIFDPERASAYGVSDHEALVAGGVVEVSEEVPDARGGLRLLHTRKIVVSDRDRKPRYVLGISEDITDRIAAENERAQIARQLQQAQKMEAIGQLTGGIAHDFNNILASILGYAWMARRLDEDDGKVKLSGYLDQIVHGVERGRGLIRTMSSYVRGSGGASRPLLLEPHIREVMDMLAATVPAGIQLSTRIDESLPPVMGDPVHLQQILSNLVVNARDALVDKGRIEVEAHESHLARCTCDSCHQAFSGTYVELAVRDTGSGITPEIRDRVFDPFFTTKDYGKGTGLGLPMVHGLVHEHGGHVTVESAPGTGSVFRVWWCVSSAGVAPADSVPGDESACAPAVRSAHIVVVDDDQSLLAMLSDLLRQQGYQVSAFHDPVLAREFMAAPGGRVDLLVTDQSMPGLDGVELARSAHELWPELPAILMSGFSEIVGSENYRQFGFQAFLEKPFEPMLVIRVVASLLGDAVH